MLVGESALLRLIFLLFLFRCVVAGHCDSLRGSLNADDDGLAVAKTDLGALTIVTDLGIRVRDR